MSIAGRRCSRNLTQRYDFTPADLKILCFLGQSLDVRNSHALRRKPTGRFLSFCMMVSLVAVPDQWPISDTRILSTLEVICLFSSSFSSSVGITVSAQ